MERIAKQGRTVGTVAAAALGVFAASVVSSPASAVPVAGQIVPMGVYLNTTSAFGLAYDPIHDIIHYSQGALGDGLVHTVKPFKNYTPAELVALPLVGGIPSLSLAASLHDLGGTTTPAFGSAHFNSLGFNAATGQIVSADDQGAFLGSVYGYDPFTGANAAAIPSVGDDFADGLDFDGSNRWFSPNQGSIFNNGVLFVSNGDNSKTLLPIWTGLGSADGLGWSGVEQVGASLFAVAVQTNADTGRSRTLVRFDAITGELLGFDPDGDPLAARWEYLAFDGKFLYAADLRGNADDTGVSGDIYVFAVEGGLAPPGRGNRDSRAGDPRLPRPRPRGSGDGPPPPALVHDAAILVNGGSRAAVIICGGVVVSIG